MKNLILFTALLLIMGTNMAQVAINSTATDPDASAMLDVSSTSKGFLPPRMTEVQMNAISSPAEGLIVYCTDCEPVGIQTYDGSDFVSVALAIPNIGSSYGAVVNNTTGQTWLDRNLGATQVATSSTDAAAYGDLYQWGRAADGHQIRTSAIYGALATTWIADEGSNNWDGKFILSPSIPQDWLATAQDDLWSGTAAENNPCPSGYRLPTNAELNQERLSWTGGNNVAGAFGSVLKLTLGGYRHYSTGTPGNVNSYGRYWSSTVDGSGGRFLIFSSSDAYMYTSVRAFGFSVRCIKD